jgi:hypothetical protein
MHKMKHTSVSTKSFRSVCLIGALFAFSSVTAAQTFTVPANAKWMNTGTTVAKRVWLRFVPSGTVNFGERDGTFGPDGTTSFPDGPNVLVASPRRFNLVARITAGDKADDVRHYDFSYGHGQTEFAIPEDAPFDEGRLWLGVNDYDSSDNTGEYTVKMSVHLTPAAEEQEHSAKAKGGVAMRSTDVLRQTTAARGMYRITINGFAANTETWDHAFEVDGKRDEVFLLSEVRMVNNREQTLLVSHPMSRVMGDINHNDWRYPASGYRVLAGSASNLGGIRTGDRFPSSMPWVRTASILPDRPPMLVFEGELVQGENGIILAPMAWEWDGSPMFLQGWLTAVQDNAPAIARAVTMFINRGSGDGNYIQDALALGLPAVGNLVRGIFGQAGDRMIGLNEKTRDQQGNISYIGKPQAIVLNYDLAELAIIQNFGKGPGVLELQYRDHADIGAGWYTLYVQIARIHEPIRHEPIRDNLQSGELLRPEEQIASLDRRYRLLYQADGNLVVYRNSDGRALWASGTNGRSAGICIMQGDGNLVVYDAAGTAVWASGTHREPGSRLFMQNDGNLVIYNRDNRPVWATNTVQ